MKKSQILMSLLLVILLSSCYASRITYENLSIIQRGMSSKEVIAIMGKPSYRSFMTKRGRCWNFVLPSQVLQESLISGSLMTG